MLWTFGSTLWVSQHKGVIPLLLEITPQLHLVFTLILAVYIEQDAYIPSGGMMPGSGLAPAAPPPVVMYAQPAYVLDPQPTGSLACLDAW